MLPYGNARDQGGQVACQHGPAECKLNMVEACGIKHLPTAKEYMPFIFCVESGAKDGTPDALIRSCTEGNSTAKLISDCYGEGSGGEGAAAIAAVGQQTAALGHQYTPWVVIDGQHSKSGESGLKQAICDAYKGAARPSACQGDAEQHTVSKCFPDGTVVVV
mmetsp:Transcript_76582/g.216568  ORF Transcript_76582/g.216568 Transcript_76582/m.216568 type:complete len:162 (-) Transcript_76582:152-637(-)